MPQEYVRFILDFAIPKSDWDALNQGQRNKIRNDLLDIKIKSKKIGEEDTKRAKWHICRHEFGDMSCVEEEVTEDDPE